MFKNTFIHSRWALVELSNDGVKNYKYWVIFYAINFFSSVWGDLQKIDWLNKNCERINFDFCTVIMTCYFAAGQWYLCLAIINFVSKIVCSDLFPRRNLVILCRSQGQSVEILDVQPKGRTENGGWKRTIDWKVVTENEGPNYRDGECMPGVCKTTKYRTNL